MQGTISWLGALTNSALVYLFRVRDSGVFSAEHGPGAAWHTLLVPALLIALSSSHGYFLARRLVQHLMDRALWKGSDEMRALERGQDEIKRAFVKNVERDDEMTDVDIAQMSQGGQDSAGMVEFWDRDEGVNELRRCVKSA